MELVQVRIKGIVVTQRYGALSHGDILRTDAAYAQHLVEECHAAEYITAVQAQEKPKRGRKAKTDSAPAQESVQETAAE